MKRYFMPAMIVAAVCLSGPALAQQNDFMKYCKADIQRLCSKVKPGEGRMMACLKSHSKEMTVGCAQALKKMQDKAKK